MYEPLWGYYCSEHADVTASVVSAANHHALFAAVLLQPHEDGPLYHPVVCILSLGSPAVLRFWRKQEEGTTALQHCG
jgi:hypothetical protein